MNTPSDNISNNTSLKFVRNVVIKAAILFVLFNIIYYLAQPLSLLDHVSVYNTLVPGRVRLPFSEYPDQSYNLMIANLDQMLTSHEIAQPKAPDEFRVVMLGDSSVWGYLLQPDQTQSACLNREGLILPNGKKVKVYNLGYPTLTVMKDYLILRHALAYQPDLVIWPVTLASLYPSDQLDFQIIREQIDEVAALQAQHHFVLYQWPLPAPTWADHTFFGQRRTLADWLRYQLYGLGWAATGIDHVIPKFIAPHATTFAPDSNLLTVSMMHLSEQGKISAQDLSFDIVNAAIKELQARKIPLLLINEPMYRSDDPIRWNKYYPRWGYDSYRDAFKQTYLDESFTGVRALDLWDRAANDQFTDTDFHLTPPANCAYVDTFRDDLLALAESSITSGR
jgi:hypothetical protein